MRFAILTVVLAFLFTPAFAAGDSKDLTGRQQKLLKRMAAEVEHNLGRRQGESARLHSPKVKLDLEQRKMIIVTRLKTKLLSGERRAIRKRMKDARGDLCLMLQSSDVRATNLTVEVQMQMRSGSVIGKTRASPALCPE